MTELGNACVQRELELLNKGDSSMGSCLCWLLQAWINLIDA